MNRVPASFRFWFAATGIAALLFIFELTFLPTAGLQADEVLFVLPFLKGTTFLYSWRVGSLRLPVMSMDYIGALKSWLYWPIFQFWRPDVWSVRMPACAISVTTLLLFADTVRRVGGNVVALLAILFLATDATFLFTNVFDWGPVSLLLCGTVATLNLLQRYGKNGNVRYIGAAALVAGTSVWYKAVFVFPLAGMLIALVAVYFRELQQRLSPRVVFCALAAFAVGISPLIAFNIARSGATIAATGYIGSAPVSEKVLMMRRTLDGRALEHYMFRSFPHERIALQGAPLPVLVESWYRTSRLGPGSALPAFLLCSLVALPFLRGLDLFRPLLFAWLASVATFGIMVWFRDAGAGPHHTVLVYPGPHFIVAATLVGICRRAPRAIWPVAFVSVLLAASNLYLLEQYRMAAARGGFSVFWTDASDGLRQVIEARNLPVVFLDWGVREVIRTESDDRVRVADSEEPGEGILYVSHCAGYVIDESRTVAFARKAQAAGLRESGAEAIKDLHGEPVFCTYVLHR